MQNYTYWFNSDGSRGRSYDGEWDGNTLRIQFVETSSSGETSRGRCTWPYTASFTALPDYTCETVPGVRRDGADSREVVDLPLGERDEGRRVKGCVLTPAGPDIQQPAAGRSPR